MSVKVIIQNYDWKTLWSFIWKEYKWIAQMARENNMEIPTACGMWFCRVCCCKIKKWSECVQIDKLQVPIIDLDKNKNWDYNEVLTCVWWLKTEYLKSIDEYEIILQKKFN